MRFFNISGTCDPSSGITLHGRFPVVTVTTLMDQISHCFTKQDAGILKRFEKGVKHKPVLMESPGWFWLVVL